MSSIHLPEDYKNPPPVVSSLQSPYSRSVQRPELARSSLCLFAKSTIRGAFGTPTRQVSRGWRRLKEPGSDVNVNVDILRWCPVFFIFKYLSKFWWPWHLTLLLVIMIVKMYKDLNTIKRSNWGTTGHTCYRGRLQTQVVGTPQKEKSLKFFSNFKQLIATVKITGMVIFGLFQSTENCMAVRALTNWNHCRDVSSWCGECAHVTLHY